MNISKVKKLAIYLIPITFLLLLVVYIYKFSVVFIDSDASSELVLAKLLNQTGTLVSKDWYYSTEIKLLTTNLIFTPLFSIFNSWTVIRAIGTGICMLLMLLSALFFYCQLGIRNKALLLTMLIVPISVQYFGMYIVSPYYEYSAIKAFLFLGFFIGYLKQIEKRKGIFYLLSTLLFALLQGVDGLRNILLIIVPVLVFYLVLEILNQYNKLDDEWSLLLPKLRKVTLLSSLVCVIGFAINTIIISKMFSYSSFNDMAFVNIDVEKLLATLNSWLKTFGYTTGKVMSTAILHNAFSFIIILLSVAVIVYNLKNRKIIKKETLILTSMYIIGVVILILLSLFVHFINSDMERYNLPVAILVFPLIFDWFENRFNTNKLSKGFFVTFIILFILCGVDNLNIFRNNDNRKVLKGINSGRTNYDTIEMKDVTYMLQEQGYKNGYSYFWNGDIITELSNGEIEMWVWDNGGNNTTELKDINKMYKWLQVKKHDTVKPSGKVFLLFTPEELDYSLITNKLDWSHVIYNSKNFTVYGYDSYDELYIDFIN